MSYERKCVICNKEFRCKKKKQSTCSRACGFKLRDRTNLERYGSTSPLSSDEVRNKIKETNLERYGVEHYSKTEEFSKQYKETMLDRHGTEYPIQNEEIKEKIKNTMVDRHGVEYTAQSKILKDKMDRTNLERYGSTSPLSSDEVRNKIKETNLERYGVENPFNNEEIRIIYKETMLDRYGTEYPIQNDEIKEKIKNTVIKKYGVDHISKNKDIIKKKSENYLNSHGVNHSLQNPEIKEQIANTLFKKYGVNHPSKIGLNENTLYYLEDDNIDKLIKMNLSMTLTEIAKHIGCSESTISHHFKKMKVMPKIHYHSTFETEVNEFIKSLNINVEKTKKIIYPYELDIFIQDKNLAIECNGAYWHSELHGKDKKYHLNKTQLCKDKNIHVLHIWDYIWYNKMDIIKSIIKSYLNKNNIIYGRKCIIGQISNDEEKIFLNKNHIQGYIPSSIKYGLYYNNELVSIMTFGKSRFDKNYEWELLRFCNKTNLNIIGGASKLFKHFIKNEIPTSIISYCHNHLFNGRIYEILGFTFKKNTKPSYYYTKDYKNFYNRIVFQKHKLKQKLNIFDDSLTEWENMKMNDYDRIWDCGNSVWVWQND